MPKYYDSLTIFPFAILYYSLSHKKRTAENPLSYLNKPKANFELVSYKSFNTFCDAFTWLVTSSRNFCC